MAQIGLDQLWRPRGTNCHLASRIGARTPMDFRETVFARPELLHDLARPRSATTGDLHRLVDAQNLGRGDCGCLVCAALAAAVDRLVLDLRQLGQLALDGGFVLRHQTCGGGHRCASGASHWLARTQKQSFVGHCSCFICGNFCVRCCVSVHRLERGGAGFCGIALRAPLVCVGRRPCPIKNFTSQGLD